MCCSLVKGKVIMHPTLLSAGLVDVYSIYLKSCLSHTSYVLGAQKFFLCETVILSTQNMCCGLVKGK